MPDFKKGQRIECTVGEAVVTGFVYSASPVVKMLLDDGKSMRSGPSRAFRPSNAEIPKDSPFAELPLLKKGAQVDFTYKDEAKVGFIKSVSVPTAKIIGDGYEYEIPLMRVKVSRDLTPTALTPAELAARKKGAWVKFDFDGQPMEGMIKSASGVSAKVNVWTKDGPAYTTVLLSKLTPAPAPRDVASPMDRWSLVGYKSYEGLSEETTAFTSKIALDGKVVIEAKNDGHGGCNMYYGSQAVLEQFRKDSDAWVKQFGYSSDIENEGVWVDWAADNKQSGVLAAQYLERQEQLMRQMLGLDRDGQSMKM